MPGWNTAELDDSAWKAAAVFSPKVRLSAEMIEPNRRIETLKPVEIASPRPGVFRVDMGRNYAGWFEIRMKGRPGQKVTLEFAERPEREQTHTDRQANTSSALRAKECSATASIMPLRAGSRFAA